ncbi:MAG: hypothetical protein OXO49_02040 [Gammaproteobacteria bacterium]|nr:hypothetical protein [Gammaproteobacteria bacterium]MDE0251284.1 hypothetical protein [Gammaproteobacteria bacterium]MDE0402031.1 hypothetical protein [Gammaproteobacteria bacterium]
MAKKIETAIQDAKDGDVREIYIEYLEELHEELYADIERGYI